MENYINTYVEKYIRKIMEVKDLNKFTIFFSIIEMGKNWDWRSNYQKGDVILFCEGILSRSFFRMVVYLNPAGYLFGRYYNENGTHQDVNGYVKRNGNIEIQLWHKSETSYLTLSPYEQFSTDNAFAYKGVWGKRKKSVDMIFYPAILISSIALPTLKISTLLNFMMSLLTEISMWMALSIRSGLKS